MTENPRTTSPTSPPDWDALARYHAGESPADEARLVATWLAANPRDAAVLAALDDAIERAVDASRDADGAVAAIDVEAALRLVKARRDAESGATVLPFAPRTAGDASAARAPRRTPIVVPPRTPMPMRGRRNVWLTAGGLAAAAALALLLRSDATELPATATPIDGAPVPAASALRVVAAGGEVVTRVGERDSLRLPDGTRVVLAPGARLAVAAGFGTHGREVTLEGQAHFTATHDAAAPFTVRTARAIVRDLGTVFTVRTDGVGAAGPSVAVSVTEGRVGVAAPSTGADSAIVLDAGDRAELGDAGATRVERGVVAADDVAWATSGTLSYRAAPLAMVAADLQRWRGVTLRTDDPALAGRRLTATFGGEPTEQVLQVIALALGATVERRGDTAVLRAAGDAAR